MATIRATAKLLKKLRAELADPTPTATNRLGDWYANYLIVGREHLVLFTSSVTLLPVLVTLKESRTLVLRFAEALGDVLLSLRVPEDLAREEVAYLSEVAFARTRSRQVLGSMNDFAFMFEYTRPQRLEKTLLDESLWLADTPCSPIGMESPGSRTLELFTSPATARLRRTPKAD